VLDDLRALWVHRVDVKWGVLHRRRMQLPGWLWLCLLVPLGSACREEPNRPAATVIDVPQPPNRMPVAHVLEPVDAPKPASFQRIPEDDSFARLPCKVEGRVHSLVSEESLQVEFANRGSLPLSMFWLNFEGARVHYFDLAPGESYEQQTYVSHPWIAIASDGRCVGVVIPQLVGSARTSVAFRP
jgi:hypothetical protein